MDIKGLIDNFTSVVTKHYFDFHGRARRAEFWQYILVFLVIYIVLAITRIRILSALLVVGLFLPNLGLAVRRLHDIGLSGLYVLLPAAPAILAVVFLSVSFVFAGVLMLATLAADIYLIYLLAKPGMPGPNQYGDDPKVTLAAAPNSSSIRESLGSGHADGTGS